MRRSLSAKWVFASLIALFLVLAVVIIVAQHSSHTGITIAISIVLVLVELATIPAVIAFRRQWDREQRAKHNQCLACGYNLAGNVSGTCPECGNKIATS